MLSLAAFVLVHLVAIAALALAGYVVGRRLTRSFSYPSVGEEIACSLALGLGAIAYLTLALGLLGLLYRWVMLAALAAALLACLPVWRELFPRIGAWLRSLGWRRGLLVLLLVVLGLALFSPFWLMPLYPPTATDSLIYHLPYAKEFVSHHRIAPAPYLRVPIAPQTNEVLFGLMLLLVDDLGAQLVQFLMMLCVALLLFAWGRRAFSPAAGWLAAAIFLGNPMVVWLGAVAYIEMSLALFITAGAYAFFNWVATRETRWLSLSAAFIGFAAGTKYNALFFVFAFALLAFYFALRQRRFRPAFVFVLVALAVASPWYLRNYYYTGNPVFAYFPSVFAHLPRLFPPADWSAVDYGGDQVWAEAARYGTGKSLRSLALLPWHLARQPALFFADAPVSRVIFLLLPLSLIFAFRDRRARWMLGLAAGYLLFWFLSAQVIRYLVPVFPLLGLLGGAGLGWLLSWRPIARRWLVTGGVSLACAYLLFHGLAFAAYYVRLRGPLPVTPAQREAYLAPRVPGYPAVQFLNKTKGSRYRLYGLFTETMHYPAQGTLLGEWSGRWRYSRVQEKLDLGEGETLYQELKDMGAQYFLVHTDRFPVDLPDDVFFRVNFTPIFTRPSLALYALSPSPRQPRSGPELLTNPSFENLVAGVPAAWERQGKPAIDASGAVQHLGRTAVQARGTANFLYQTVPVSPGRLYQFSAFTQSPDVGQKALLTVIWMSPDHRPLAATRKKDYALPRWDRLALVAPAPDGAAAATVCAGASSDSAVWLDDASFTEIGPR